MANEVLYDCAGNEIVLVPKGDFDPGALKKIRYDQAVVFERSADGFDVEIYNNNPDGAPTRASNCLNGMRAMTDFVARSLGVRDRIRLVQDGILLAEGEQGAQYPNLYLPMPTNYVQGNGEEPDLVVLGNSHFVYWPNKERETKTYDFPNVPPSINMEFVTFYDGRKKFLRVIEAGVGETKSCGSGAVATVYSAYQRFGDGHRVNCLFFPGGEIYVELRGNEIFLTGHINGQVWEAGKKAGCVQTAE